MNVNEIDRDQFKKKLKTLSSHPHKQKKHRLIKSTVQQMFTIIFINISSSCIAQLITIVLTASTTTTAASVSWRAAGWDRIDFDLVPTASGTLPPYATTNLDQILPVHIERLRDKSRLTDLDAGPILTPTATSQT